MFKDLIEYIVKSLVDYPDQVVVREVTGETVVIVELTVTEEDLGKSSVDMGERLKRSEVFSIPQGCKPTKRLFLN